MTPNDTNDTNDPGARTAQNATELASLMDLTRSFVAFKTVATALDLDLFSKLSGRSAALRELAIELDLNLRPAEIILTACTALGLLQLKAGTYSNSPVAEEFLVRGKPDWFGPVIKMFDSRLYRPCHALTAAAMNNRPQIVRGETGPFETIAADPESQRIFTEAMHALSVHTGRAIATALDFSSSRRLLDVGGASGVCSIEITRANDHLKAVIFDLPGALTVAKEKIDEAGLKDRVRVEPGDFFGQPLPHGFDVMLVSNVLHDWCPEKSVLIIRRCMESLAPGGMIIVSDIMMDDQKTGSLPAALTSVIMLIAQEGRCYSGLEYSRWLEEAGFVDLRRVHLDGATPSSLVTGRKLP